MEYNGETFEQLLAAGNYSSIDLDPNESLTYYGEYMLDEFSRGESDAVWEDFQDRYSDMVAAGGSGIDAAKAAFDAAWTDAQNAREGSRNASINTTSTRLDSNPGTTRVGPVQPERRDYIPNRKPEYIEPRALPEPPVHRNRRGGSEPRRGLGSVLRSVGRIFRRNRN